MGIGWKPYGKMDSVHFLKPSEVQTALENMVFWEPKRDGSNISIMFHKGFPLIYTRNQKAIPAVETEVKALIPDMDLLEVVLGEDLILYAELMRKGKSPAGFERTEEAELLAFDVWDIAAGKYLEPREKLPLFHSAMLRHISPYATSLHFSTEEFEEEIDHMIERARAYGYEGWVAKWFHKDQMYAIKVKVEHKYPRKKGQKKDKAKRDPRPDLETSEVLGAIDKVYREMGEEDFFDKRIAMPLIAKAVTEEEKKHGKKNRESLYTHYLDFVTGLKEEVI